jgi:tetratricopeptide (TPR) repeat protein
LLFEAVAACFTGPVPVLLVLDDLHWADHASMSLLAFLMAHVPAGHLVTIAIVRDTDMPVSVAGALAELRRVTTVEQVNLTGLAGEPLTSLISAVAGAPVSDALVASVSQATDGNPFFVEELTEHLLSTDDATGSVVPRTVRETLAKRIDTVSGPAQALLRAGAALGRLFDMDVAGRVADLTGESLLAAVEDALLSGLVSEISATQLLFNHALVQSAVYETTSARRRLELHRRAAAELEAVTDNSDMSDAAVFDIARHWSIVAASDKSAQPSAAHWAMRAGDAAAAATDIDEAVVRYQQAEQLLRAGTTEHAEALIRLGAAENALGRLEQADEHLRAAQELADGLGDHVLFARAVIGRTGTVLYGHSDPERVAALERSIATLEPDQHVLRISAASMLKRQLGYDRSPDAFQRRQHAAHIVLDAVTAPQLSRELLLSLGSARDSMAVDDPVELGRLSLKMIEAASRPRNLGVLANGWFWNAWSTLELGDLPGWNRATTAFTEVANQLRLPFEMSMAAIMASTVALLEGRYAQSETLSQEALTLGMEGGDPNASSAHLIGAVLRGLDLGQAPDMIDLMKAMRAELADVPTFMGGLTMTAAVAGDHDLTRELLAEQTTAGFENAKKNLEWLPSLGFLSHACAIVDDTSAAEILYAELVTATATAIRIGPIAAWFGPVDYHLGALCRVLGRHDEARSRLRAALTMCQQWRSEPWLARSQNELARALDHDRTNASHQEALALRHAATTTLTAIGASGIAIGQG